MKIVLATGGFDPLHSGHIKYLQDARKLGDRLIIGLNSDAWLERKKGRAFMPFAERQSVLSALDCTGYVVSFDDSDGSAIKFLEDIKKSYPYAEIIFANGGDRTATNIPEMSVEGIKFEFGVGGNTKVNSSSWILDDWKTSKTNRTWGYWRVLNNNSNYKIKELVINPKESISFQRHQHRNEHWYILKGSCLIKTEYLNVESTVHKEPHSTYVIGRGVWHQIQNNSNEPCHILEVQYGDQCVEEDIERR